MVGRIPGSLCFTTSDDMDEGTLARITTPVPGSVGYVCPYLSTETKPELNLPYPKWTVADVAMWKLWPESKGGGKAYLFSYKDGWISHNKAAIKEVAELNKIPVDLLAGIAWIEVGGDPDFIDSVTYPVRSFDWSGSDWIDKNLTITKNPYQTSVGSVSIQLSNVASVLGINLDKLTYAQQLELVKCLENDVVNLKIVAKHLLQLIRHDFPEGGINMCTSTTLLTDNQLIIVASRYNRGTKRILSDFFESINAPKGSAKRVYTEYGRTLLNHRDRIRKLLL